MTFTEIRKLLKVAEENGFDIIVRSGHCESRFQFSPVCDDFDLTEFAYDLENWANRGDRIMLAPSSGAEDASGRKSHIGGPVLFEDEITRILDSFITDGSTITIDSKSVFKIFNAVKSEEADRIILYYETEARNSIASRESVINAIFDALEERGNVSITCPEYRINHVDILKLREEITY